MLDHLGIPRLRATPVCDATPHRPSWLTGAPDTPNGADGPVSAAPAEPESAGYRHSSISDYRSAYAAGRADPVSVARAALDAARSTAATSAALP